MEPDILSSLLPVFFLRAVQRKNKKKTVWTLRNSTTSDIRVFRNEYITFWSGCFIRPSPAAEPAAGRSQRLMSGSNPGVPSRRTDAHSSLWDARMWESFHVMRLLLFWLLQQITADFCGKQLCQKWTYAPASGPETILSPSVIFASVSCGPHTHFYCAETKWRQPASL